METAVQSSRQLPIKQFRAELYRDTKSEVVEYAVDAGCKLAEVLVRSHKDIESMTQEELDRFRKAYGVYKEVMSTFVKSCKEAIPFERAWQFTLNGQG